MSNLSDDYANRLADLLEDMEDDGIDSVSMMMSWVAGFVQGKLKGKEDSVYLYQFEHADMIIQLSEPEEIISVRLH